jgi:predicted PurR-regulated permease PerM
MSETTDKRLERMMETREKLILSMVIAHLAHAIVGVFIWIAITRIARSIDRIAPALTNGSDKISVALDEGNISRERQAIVWEEMIKGIAAERDKRERGRMEAEASKAEQAK